MTMPAPLDPSTAEERALAQRLARLGPHGEPSPQLDARVLAAARASLDAPPLMTHRSRRWPVALGVAASLVLAVGVAWRLRPWPPGSTTDLATPVRPAAQGAPAAPAPPTDTAPLASEPADAGPTAPAAPPATGDARNVAEPPAPPAPAPRHAAKTVATPAPDVQADAGEPTPVTFEAPAPEAAAQSARKTDAEQGTGTAGTSDSQVDELDRIATPQAQPEASDEPLDAMPPATADAPGVRDAWLSRIRALIDSGDVAGGRRSLRAFSERYPDYPLPEDLRALLR